VPQLQGGGWLSTHPSSSERLDNVRKFAMQYAALAPAAPPPGPDTSKPANPFAEAVTKIQADIEAHCKKDELQAFYKKTACHTKDISFEQMTDASKVSDEEKTAIQKARNDIAEFDRRMATVLRQYGGAKGPRLASLIDNLDAASESLMLDLYTQKIAWGDYNKRRKELNQQSNAQIDAIKAAK